VRRRYADPVVVERDDHPLVERAVDGGSVDR
jgi:hypothetical protein